jgi:hypothetical protein
MKKWMVVLMVLIGMRGMGQVTFQKMIGGLGDNYALSVQQTNDEGYIILGYTSCYGTGYYDSTNQTPHHDIYLIKMNSMGDTLWTKTYGQTTTSATDNKGYSVQQTMDKGYIITGITNFGFAYDGLYLMKTDSNGVPIWTKIYGTYLMGAFYGGYSVQQTSDGGYIIGGITDSIAGDSSDVYLIKTNSIGTILWTKTYGGIGDDEGYSVQQTTDGGYIITGETSSFGAGGYDVYLIKTDSIGDTLWTKTYGGPGDDEGFCVKQTSDGGFIIAGETAFGVGHSNAYLIKTDSIGDTLWTKTYGGGGTEFAQSVQLTADGGYILLGFSNDFGGLKFYLIKTDSIGDTLWTKSLGMSFNFGTSCQQTTDGGYILAGAYYYGYELNNLYIIKTDSLGNSGCYQNNTGTIITTPHTQVTSPSTHISSGGFLISGSNHLNSGGGIITNICYTGEKEIKQQSFSISLFPNPFSTSAILLINGEIKENSHLYIYNLLGQEVKTIPIINQKEITINRDNLADGMYFYKIITNKNETVAMGKMVIQ